MVRTEIRITHEPTTADATARDAVFGVNAPLTVAIESYDPFQKGWQANTPDDFRAILRHVLDGGVMNTLRALVGIDDVRRAAQL